LSGIRPESLPRPLFSAKEATTAVGYLPPSTGFHAAAEPEDLAPAVGAAPSEPSKTIFIDDLWPNIQGAQAAGWHTYHHNPKDDLIEIFKYKLNL